jgi:hypothetical protein
MEVLMFLWGDLMDTMQMGHWHTSIQPSGVEGMASHVSLEGWAIFYFIFFPVVFVLSGMIVI